MKDWRIYKMVSFKIDIEPKNVDMVIIIVEALINNPKPSLHKELKGELIRMAEATDLLRQAQKKNKILISLPEGDVLTFDKKEELIKYFS